MDFVVAEDNNVHIKQKNLEQSSFLYAFNQLSKYPQPIIKVSRTIKVTPVHGTYWLLAYIISSQQFAKWRWSQN